MRKRGLQSESGWVTRLRALGVTADEISRLVFAEALVLAVIGTLLGIVAGSVLGRGLTQIVASAVSSLYYDVPAADMPIAPLSVVKAALLGIAGTFVATWLPARQAAATHKIRRGRALDCPLAPLRQLPLSESPFAHLGC